MTCILRVVYEFSIIGEAKVEKRKICEFVVLSLFQALQMKIYCPSVRRLMRLAMI